MLSDKTVEEVEMVGGKMAVPSEGSFQGVPSSKQGDPEINQVSFKVRLKVQYKDVQTNIIYMNRSQKVNILIVEF